MWVDRLFPVRRLTSVRAFTLRRTQIPEARPAPDKPQILGLFQQPKQKGKVRMGSVYDCAPRRLVRCLVARLRCAIAWSRRCEGATRASFGCLRIDRERFPVAAVHDAIGWHNGRCRKSKYRGPARTAHGRTPGKVDEWPVQRASIRNTGQQIQDHAQWRRHRGFLFQ